MMKNYVHDGHTYVYDSNYWEVIKIPQKLRVELDFQYEDTIVYIGPIVDGEITDEPPEFPIYCQTFANQPDLVEPPSIKCYAIYKPFENCPSLNPSKEWCDEFKNYSPVKHSYSDVFADCNSENIVDIASFSCLADALSAIFKTTKEKVLEYDPKVEDHLGYLDIKWELDGISAKKLVEMIKTFNTPEGLTIFSTGAYLLCTTAKSTNEIEGHRQGMVDNYIVSGPYVNMRFYRNNTRVYKVDADELEISSNDSEIYAELRKPLKNVQLQGKYDAKENGVIVVEGDCSITSETACIVGAGTLTIKGEGSLTLKSGAMHATIGTETHTGMSYGRWCPGHGSMPDKIIVDGVDVVCESEVENFSLGNYGTNKMPAVELINGGTLICPEASGARMLLKSGSENLIASTKRWEPAQYTITDGPEFMTEIDDRSLALDLWECTDCAIERSDVPWVNANWPDIYNKFKYINQCLLAQRKALDFTDFKESYKKYAATTKGAPTVDESSSDVSSNDDSLADSSTDSPYSVGSFSSFSK